MGTNVPDRWMVEIVYRSAATAVLVVEELEDLDEIVEQGPDWHTIERIVITLNRTAWEPRREEPG
jgi:hypothetical protein